MRLDDEQPGTAAPWARARPLLTIGHGSRQALEVADALQAAGVQLLVDVRRFPGSRRQPDLASGPLSLVLAEQGIDYVWEQDLGGRRHLPAGEPAVDC